MAKTSELTLSIHERVDIGVDLGESHFREFKSALAGDRAAPAQRDVKALCRDIAETLVAFANADGGELLVGVEDDGTVTGVPHSDDLIKKMKVAHREYVHPHTPLPTPLVAEIWHGDDKVLYLSIEKSIEHVHLTSDGRCLRRTDRENRPVPAEDIQRDRTEVASRSYDREFVDGASVGDLDLEQVTRAGQEVAAGYSPEKVLQYFQLAEYAPLGLRLRRAALLLFANDIARWHPRSTVRIVRAKGTSLGVGDSYNAQQDEQVTGTVFELIEKAWEALRPHLARTTFQESGLFKESLIYPEQACREALINAIAHRDYSREGTGIEVFVFDDRMEFKSPGGLLSTVSINALSELKGVHESRNPTLARVLRQLGYKREMGEGIPRMFRAMRQLDLVDPELTSHRDSFGITLRHKSTFTDDDIRWLDGYREFDLSKNEQRLVLSGRDRHPLSTDEILHLTGFVNIDDFRALLDGMRLKGLLYNAKHREDIRKNRRTTGRFRVRTPNEAEAHFGELLRALRALGMRRVLAAADLRSIRRGLPEANPFGERLDSSLRALGFIDREGRLLGKAVTYVPELASSGDQPLALEGRVVTKKPGLYGFIRTADNVDYFFHASSLKGTATWDAIAIGSLVRFRPKPSTGGQRDAAIDVSLP